MRTEESPTAAHILSVFSSCTLRPWCLWHFSLEAQGRVIHKCIRFPWRYHFFAWISELYSLCCCVCCIYWEENYAYRGEPDCRQCTTTYTVVIMYFINLIVSEWAYLDSLLWDPKSLRTHHCYIDKNSIQETGNIIFEYCQIWSLLSWNIKREDLFIQRNIHGPPIFQGSLHFFSQQLLLLHSPNTSLNYKSINWSFWLLLVLGSIINKPIYVFWLSWLVHSDFKKLYKTHPFFPWISSIPHNMIQQHQTRLSGIFGTFVAGRIWDLLVYWAMWGPL